MYGRIKNIINYQGRTSLIAGIVLIFLVSCTERIDIDLGTTYTRLVVYGEITSDTAVQYIKLSGSGDYYQNSEPDWLSGAEVQLSWADTSLLLVESDDLKGRYATPSDFHGIPGETYFLTIENVDIDLDGEYEVYESGATMPFTPPIDSIGLKYTSNTFFSGWEVMLYAWDPGDVRNFYSFRARKNGILLTDTLTEFAVQSDDFFNGNYTFGITAQFLNDENPTEKAEAGDTIVFELAGITEEYFNFIFAAQSEAFQGTPLFSGPPANIRSNISNGALGFFTTYSIQRKSIIVPALTRK